MAKLDVLRIGTILNGIPQNWVFKRINQHISGPLHITTTVGPIHSPAPANHKAFEETISPGSLWGGHTISELQAIIDAQ